MYFHMHIAAQSTKTVQINNASIVPGPDKPF